jgi:TonB family protein
MPIAVHSVTWARRSMVLVWVWAALNRRFLALLLSLLGHAVAIGLLLLWSKSTAPEKKPKLRPVTIRALSNDAWAQNRGKTSAPSSATKPKHEAPPKGQIVDVAPGNNQRPDESKFLAETNNRIEKETRAREQTNTYSRATAKTQPKPEAAPAAKGLTGGRAAPPVSAVSALDRLTGNNGRPQRLTQLLQEAASGKESNLAAPDKAGQEDGEVVPAVTGDSTEQGGGAPPDDLSKVEKGAGTYLNTREWKYAAFFNRVKQAVAARWKPMERLRSKDPGADRNLGTRDRITVLGVSLRPDGTIADIYVSESSGVELLDQESIQAFERAAPFANPPEALVENGLIRFAFGFNVMNDSAMRFR